jgi:7-cyano-7-deazaguanine synthase
MTKDQSPALVVLSGGQDSTTCLYWALSRFSPVHALVVNYGQRHSRELDAASVVAARAGVDVQSVGVPGVLRSRSPLTDPTQVLEQYADAQQMATVIGDRVELTFVPMRNAFFLTLAANRAVALDCYDLITGVCEADNANYPDCRLEFVVAQEHAITKALGLRDGVFRIHTPLMFHSKAQTVRLACATPGAYSALAYTHTAYDGAYPPTGHDHATLLRAQGFVDADLPDPLVLRAAAEGVMALPTTNNYHPEALRGALEYLKADAQDGYLSPWVAGLHVFLRTDRQADGAHA